MTTLIERLRADTKAALKAKDVKKRTALSTLTAEAERAGLDDGKRESTDAEVETAIREAIKNGNKTLASLDQLGDKAPAELREKTKYEQALYATYLPQPASEADVRAAIATIVDAMPVAERIMKNMGTVMGKLNAQFGDDFDKALASKLVKEALSVKVPA
jgi:uncharacterized protein YqeY